MSLVVLPVFILLALVSLGVLAGIIALLINPRTRVATGIVLVVAAPAILLVVATGFVVFARYTAHDVEMAREQAAQQMEIRKSKERTDTPPSGKNPEIQGYYREGTFIQSAEGLRYYQEGADIQRPPGTFPTKGSSSMAWRHALPASILVALVSLGVLAGIIALLINPRTRVATGIVLVVAPLILLVVAAALVLVRTRGAAPMEVVSQPTTTAALIERAETPPSGNIPVIAPGRATIEPPPGTPPTAPPPEQGNDGVAGDGGTVTGAPPIAPPAAAEKVAVKPPTSLAPGGSAARPAWVDAPPQLVVDVYQMAVVVGPYTTRQECDANLPEAIQEAVDQYVEVCLGPEEIDAVRLPAEYLRQQLVKDRWEEVRQHSIGPMTQLHVLLRFDRKVKERVIKEHRQAVVAHRLWLTGAGLAAALGLLAAAFGYLKLTGFRVQGSELESRVPSTADP